MGKRYGVQREVSKIEADPKLGASGLPASGILSQGEGKAFPCSISAAKSYVIDLASTELEAYLKLNAGGNLDSRIIFQCTACEAHQILACSLGGRGSETFTLRAREQ